MIATAAIYLLQIVFASSNDDCYRCAQHLDDIDVFDPFVGIFSIVTENERWSGFSRDVCVVIDLHLRR